MKFYFLNGFFLGSVAALLALFCSLWLPMMYALTPGAFAVTKEYHDCREPGLFSSGAQEGEKCYDTAATLNPPYDQHVITYRIWIVTAFFVSMFLYGLTQTPKRDGLSRPEERMRK